jgi:molecular chaperone DnaK
VPQIEVTFDLDANGILKVTAKDKATNKEQNITITASGSLSKDEVEKMKADAEAHKAEDEKKKDLIEAKNMAESLIYQSEKTLKDGGDKVKPDDKREVEDAITALKGVMNGDNLEEISAKTTALMETIQKVGAAMYEENKETDATAPEEKTPESDETKSDETDTKEEA